jgi:hypothetical protein
LKSNYEHKIYFPQYYIPKEFFSIDSVSLLVFYLHIKSTTI